jgi:alanyl-tRNA synthetase
LDFFKAKKHKIVESDSLVPKDDPTVLFTPAGMNQFKQQFLGHLSGFTRAATAQRCLRTDDLDKVGKTHQHHTFFEMLGNFSFGDYFKEEAIAYAWEFLREELKIAKERLWVSIYKDDDDAYRIWKDKINVPENKIIKLGDKENFWPAEAKVKGPNGPCGPCSEIFFDQGNTVGCRRPACDPSCSCGRFVEVWNLVFTQFNRKEGGILEPLPKKNIDTGMGLERLAAVMQGVYTNFETDLFKPIIEEITSNIRSPVSNARELICAIADHIRAILFAIYDGALPSNEARGYVARKLIRKSVLHLRALGIEKPFLYKLVPVVSEIMKVPYPELSSRRENIAQIILAEEKSFITVLNSSDTLFSKISLSADVEKVGEVVFQLYDTYGIPVEETETWLKKQGFKNLLAVVTVVHKKLEQQKTRSKLQSSMKGDIFDIKGLHLGGKKTNFVGYTKYETKAKIIKIIKDNVPVKKITKGEEAKIILDKTVFYPESGGQVGDIGEFIKGKNIFKVLDTQQFDKVIVHKGVIKEGSFKTNDEVKAGVDIERRLSIARNHTATHLLQAALRSVLGAHVQQQGSKVCADRLRFDFTHFKDINKDELNRIEEVVNSYIINNRALRTKMITLSEAKKQGALAFFGEKYERNVRMVSISDFSKELCGGTHLDSTGGIGLFKIINEGSVASGTRRIEAVTAGYAYKAIKEEENIMLQVSSRLNVPADKITQELGNRISRLKELEKQFTARKLDTLKLSVDSDINKGEDIKGINFITPVYTDMDSVRKAVDLIKDKVKKNAIIFSSTGTNLENQILWAIGVTEDLCSRGVDATLLGKEIGSEISGSCGGRKDFAQGGGNKPQNYKNVVLKLKDTINKLL